MKNEKHDLDTVERLFPAVPSRLTDTGIFVPAFEDAEKKDVQLLLNNMTFINHNDFPSSSVTPRTFTPRNT